MASSRSFTDIVAADDTLRELRRRLQEQTDPLAVMFVDLCDSTRLKSSVPQADWLPLICRFLFTISRVVASNGGRVVKYIGDEVFAVFPEDANFLATVHAETTIWQCEAELSRLGEPYAAKYVLDYGEGASVDFPGAPQDVLGSCVDRAARIGKLAEAGTALASVDFVGRSKNRCSWRGIGSFAFKGIPSAADVFQLQGLGRPIVIPDPALAIAAPKDLAARVRDLAHELDRCREEIRRTRFSS